MVLKSACGFLLVVSVAACSQSGPAQSAGTTTSTPQPAAAAPGEPAASAAAKPTFREVTIPAGAAFNVRLTTPLASDKNKAEDQVHGTLVRAIVVGGETVVPAGTPVAGTVVEVKESGRVKGRASIAFEFNRMTLGDETHNMRTARVSREAAHNMKSDVKKGAIGAGAGALVGALIGGGKGAAIGAGVGGAGAVVATKGDEVHLPAGTTVSTKLQDPLEVMVPVR